MRVYATSSAPAVALGSLTAGQDLVLHLAEPHALRVPLGVAGDDHLEPDVRAALDRQILAMLFEWRAAFDDALTVDGLCLPLATQWPLMEILTREVRAGAGLLAAVRHHRPVRLVACGGEPGTVALVRAVAEVAGIPADTDERVATAPGDRSAPERAKLPSLQRARQRAVRSVLRAGAPSHLRRGSVVALSYWPLVPLLDRLLARDDVRVAIPLGKPPAGPRRGLRALADGGWLGLPGARGKRAAGGRARPVLAAARALEAPVLDAAGFDVGPAVHPALLAEIEAQAVELVALAVCTRRGYRRGRPGLLLITHDAEPFERVLTMEANTAGVPVFALAHGTYLMPQTVLDMELADSVAVYTEAVGVPGMRRDRAVHEVGYPIPIEVAPPRPPRSTSTPRVVVLGQNGHAYTAYFSERVIPDHYRASLSALERVLPSAEIVLRPHPSQNLVPVRDAIARFGSLRVTMDTSSPIDELLASADLCIGSLSTATLQAAVHATPVAVLNITGFDWIWPLGGDTPVPVAGDADQLAAVLREWLERGTLAGRDELVSALGADQPGAVDRLEELVVAALRAPGAAGRARAGA